MKQLPLAFLLFVLFASMAGGQVSVRKGDDPNLLDAVRHIAGQVERLRGESFERPPEAVRAPDAMRDVAAEIRAFNVLSRERLAARGRSWADVGLGGIHAPRRLLLALAADLEGIGFDPAGNRLLVSPDRLKEEDFEPTTEATDPATVLMLTGVRPDEPLIGHLLMHVRQRERLGRDPMEQTTDRLLARMAWAEGEANLIAIRFLFEGMGLADEITASRLHPGEVLDGSLLPPGLMQLAGIEKGLVRFVYLDGFDRAVERHRAAGWEGLDRAMERSATTRDLLHPEAPPLPTPVFPEPVPPSPGLELMDTDSLGEQAIVVLVSTMTGKDSLGLVAGEGWAGDRLYRWERAGDDGRGITDWITLWSSAEAAADFDYAFGRTLESRFPGRALEPVAEGRRRLVTPDRELRLERQGRTVRVVVSPAGAR